MQVANNFENHNRVVDIYEGQQCSICGLHYKMKKVREKAKEEAHSFCDNGDEIVCEDCGYVLECDHANTKFVVDDEYDPEFENTGDPDKHFVHGRCGISRECPDCGYTFNDEKVYYESEPAPHIFNDGDVCLVCGYVKENCTMIALSMQKTKQLAVGETWTPPLNIAPKAATGVTYNSSNTKIFDVNSSTGLVTAKKVGKAKLTASCGDLKASCTMTVKKAAKSISLPDRISLAAGETVGLVAAISPKKSFANVRYASDDPCVKIDPAIGDIVAVSAGTAHITATAATINGQLTAQCVVTVRKAPKSISLSGVPKQMGKGEKFTAPVVLLDEDGAETEGQVRFKSSNTKVLKVGEFNGKITAAGTGTAKIYAFAYNGAQSSVEVEVKKAPKGIALAPKDTNVTLHPGETYTFKAEITSGSASQLNWSSNREQIATVEPTENPGEFKITAVAAGKTKIKISTFNKKKKTITVTVK